MEAKDRNHLSREGQEGNEGKRAALAERLAEGRGSATVATAENIRVTKPCPMSSQPRSLQRLVRPGSVVRLVRMPWKHLHFDLRVWSRKTYAGTKTVCLWFGKRCELDTNIQITENVSRSDSECLGTGPNLLPTNDFKRKLRGTETRE